VSLKERYPDGELALEGGEGLRLRFTHRGETYDEYCGAIFEHPSASTETGRCSGAIWFTGQGHGKPEWAIESEEPLTLTPSLLCHCGYHGFIRDGRWMPA
jgi:uncharacterized protein DUF6527